MDQHVQTWDDAASALWLVLSSTGLQVAGTADVPGVDLGLADLRIVRELTRAGADISASGLRPELVRVIELTRTPATRRAVPSLAGDHRDPPPDRVELNAPLLLRVEDGEILVRSPSTGSSRAVEDRHVELLARIATADPTVSRASGGEHDPSTATALCDLFEHGLLRRSRATPTAAVQVEIRSTSAPAVANDTPQTPAESAPTPDLPTPATSGATTGGPPDRSDRTSILDRLRTAVALRRPRSATAGPDPVTDRRVPVWPITCADTEVGNALGLGMLIAAATAHDSGRLGDVYEFFPIRITADEALRDIVASERPGVLLLSTYIWSLGANLELADQVKRLSPETVIVLGGPSAPKYEQDAQDFFHLHPQVDVIVRGEGEVTVCELLDALSGNLSRLDALGDVDGLTVRVGDRIVRTADRPRLDDLNVVPSPYLTGLFEHLPAQQGIWAVETNRGCPYGCTFCDWGSATKSRIRKFDMERVTAELDWISRHGVQAIFVADANFGIFERDLDITRHVAALHAQRDAPTSFIASFAKNTTKYTVPIIRTLIDAGLSGDVAIAFQTTDDDTLDNISRSNIKIGTYDQLARDVRADGLPILADVMIALPGSTIETLKNDLQHCVDSDVTARVFGTMVLPNSPMNDPEYRELHQIRTDSYDQVVATTSFGPEDREQIVRFRDVFRWADHFGVLRHVMRWEAHRSGRRELDVLWQIAQVAPARPETYPLLAFMVRSGRRYMVEPMSWRAFYDEVGHFLVQELGAQDDSELRTVLAVQAALMPAPGRVFPETIHLKHDYVAFYQEVLRPTDGRRADRRLGDYPRGELTVDDPQAISPACLREMFEIEHSPEGARSLRHEGEFWQAFNWELQSPLRRALRDQYYDNSKSLPVLQKGTAPLAGTRVGDPAAAPAGA